ncbi:MAG TPA: GNAT family N-acetyltransferase [Dehalococcoidia bacterium]|nr:GNAT family N-acetyltransferase [Dehalococcoidia bacterium]
MTAEPRPARAEDIPRIEALITGEHLPAYGLDEFLETFFVLADGEHIVGCAGLEVYGEAALLRSVVIAPERRRRDEGRRLVEAALTEARRRGISRVYLFTMSAGGFFGRLGFREVQPEEFEEGVRASRQYEAVSRMPDLRARIKAMALQL